MLIVQEGTEYRGVQNDVIEKTPVLCSNIVRARIQGESVESV